MVHAVWEIMTVIRQVSDAPLVIGKDGFKSGKVRTIGRNVEEKDTVGC